MCVPPSSRFPPGVAARQLYGGPKQGSAHGSNALFFTYGLVPTVGAAIASIHSVAEKEFSRTLSYLSADVSDIRAEQGCH